MQPIIVIALVNENDISVLFLWKFLHPENKILIWIKFVSAQIKLHNYYN